MPRCDSLRIPLPSGRAMYSTAERADWLTGSMGPSTRVKVMCRPLGVQPGLSNPIQGFAQLTGTTCTPRPSAPTISSASRPGRSRSNSTREPSGETAASISNCFARGWVRTRRPLPSGRAETSRAVENLSSRTCVHTIRPACAWPCDPRVVACAGTATVSAVRVAAATSAAARLLMIIRVSFRSGLGGADPERVHEPFARDAEPVASPDDGGPGVALEQAQHEIVGGEQQRAQVDDPGAVRGQAGPDGALGDLLEVVPGDAGPVALGRVQHAATLGRRRFKNASMALQPRD